MSPSELNQIFAKFEGGFGRFVKYSDGLEMFRVEFIKDEQHYEMLCKGCRFIAGATCWEPVNLSCSAEGETLQVVDSAGGLKILCDTVSCSEQD